MNEGQSPQILVVDAQRRPRENAFRALRMAGYENVVRAESAETARRFLDVRGPFALVILDIRLGNGHGLELLEDLAPLAPRTAVIVVTEAQGLLTAIECLKKGAYDYVLKPIDTETIQLSVGLALNRRRRELEERDVRERVMEQVEQRVDVLTKTRNALLRAMCRLAEFRNPRGPVHPERVAQYSYLLAERLGRHSAYSGQLTNISLLNLYEAALLHDVGKVVLPDDILSKPGNLTPEETAVVESHTTHGRELCLAVKEELGEREDALIDMAADITAHHHERWDGGGYPDGLERSEIPLSARIVAVADYYDIWRTPMVYRPEVLQRETVAERILDRSGTKFDPVVVGAFKVLRQEFTLVEEDRRD